MSRDASVTAWINEIRSGEDAAAHFLWKRYFGQLVRVARTRLVANRRRSFDEEDVALSAFDSLCRGLRADKFPKLDGRDDLWAILLVITTRKALQRIRQEMTLKRGGGNVMGESAIEGDGATEGEPGIHQFIAREPTPEMIASWSEDVDSLLCVLPDEAMQELACLKLQGYSNREVAEKLGCGQRTVERRLSLIRQIWLAEPGSRTY